MNDTAIEKTKSERPHVTWHKQRLKSAHYSLINPQKAIATKTLAGTWGDWPSGEFPGNANKSIFANSLTTRRMREHLESAMTHHLSPLM
jgi:hypothetical protein